METPRGSLVVDSSLAPDGQAKLVIGIPDGPPVNFFDLVVVADAESRVTIQAPPNDPAAEQSGVRFELCDVTLRGTTKWETGRINGPVSTFANEGIFEVKANAGACDFYGGTLTNSGTFTYSESAPGTSLIFSPASTFNNVAGGAVGLLTGETRFQGETTFAGQLNISADVVAAFSGDNNFSGLVTIGGGGKTLFSKGTSTLTTGAAFIGDGIVSVQGQAEWDIPYGKSISVDHFILEPDAVTGMGLGALKGIADPMDPELPLPWITIGKNVELTSFALDHVFLIVPSNAVGWLSPGTDATAKVTDSIFHLEGRVYWTGGDVTLAGASHIWVGGGTAEAPATFGILTSATIKRVGAFGDSVITVATGGYFGRLVPTFTPTIRVSVVNDGGTINWAGIQYLP